MLHSYKTTAHLSIIQSKPTEHTKQSNHVWVARPLYTLVCLSFWNMLLMVGLLRHWLGGRQQTTTKVGEIPWQLG